MANALQEELTDAVYRAALEPAAWDEVMRLMRESFPSEAQTFYILHLQPHRVQPVSLAGVEPRWVRCFDEHYFARDNPWIRLTQQLHRPGVIRTNERLDRILQDPGVLYRSSYYHEWMRPQGFKFTIGNTLLAENGIVANITLLRAPDMKTFDRAEVQAFETLSTHMTRALRMGIRLERPEACPAGTAMLDAVPHAIALIDAQRRVHYLNKAMESLLARRQGLEVRQGLLGVDGEDLQRRFAACVAAALSGADAAGAAAAPMIVDRSEAGQLRLSVVPLSGALRRALVARPTALLMATEHPRLSAAPQAAIRQHYGCTASEAGLVQLLVDGNTLQECAARMGITYGSARVYMKLVFAKVGVRTQAQLVARVLRELGAASLGRRKSDA